MMEIQMTNSRHQQQWVTLNKLRKQGKFCDVIFLMNKNDEYDCLDDSIITAHSCVLSASSPILFSKLSTCYESCNSISTKMLVSLEKVATSVWELVLDYIYCRKAFISKSMPKDTVKAFVNLLAKLKLVSEAGFRSICQYCTVELGIDDVENVDEDLEIVVQKYPPENKINSAEMEVLGTQHDNFKIVINSDANTRFENDEGILNQSSEDSSIFGDTTGISNAPNSSTNYETSNTDVANTSLNFTENNTNTSANNSTALTSDLSQLEPLSVVEHIGEDLSQGYLNRLSSRKDNIDSDLEEGHADPKIVQEEVTDKEGAVSLDLSKVTYKKVIYCPLDMKESAIIKGVVSKRSSSTVKPYANTLTVKKFLDKTRKRMCDPYSCETCGAKFFEGKELSKHIKGGCNPYRYSYLKAQHKTQVNEKFTDNTSIVPDQIYGQPKRVTDTVSEMDNQSNQPVLNEVAQIKQEPLSDSEEQSSTSSNYTSSTSFIDTPSHMANINRTIKDEQHISIPESQIQGFAGNRRKITKGKSTHFPQKVVKVKEYVGIKACNGVVKPVERFYTRDNIDDFSMTAATSYKKANSYPFTTRVIKQEPEDTSENIEDNNNYDFEDSDVSDDDDDHDDSRDSDFLPVIKEEEQSDGFNEVEEINQKRAGNTPRKRGRPKVKEKEKKKKLRPNADSQSSVGKSPRKKVRTKSSKILPQHIKEENAKKREIAKEKRKAQKLLKDSIENKYPKRPVYKMLKNSNVCNLCGKTFIDGTRIKILTHQREECKVALSPDFKDRPKYLCPFCSKQLSCNYKLTFHIKVTHLGERPYPCEKCNVSFKDRNAHRDHMMQHHDDGHIVCKWCGDKFNNLDKYKRHRVAEHTDEIISKDKDGNERKVHHCDKCSYVSLNESKLKSHMLFHRDVTEWEFSCQVCDKHFVQKSDLRKHMMIHTGEKPFLCEFCSYKTNRACNLKLHMRKHIAERSEVSDGGVTEYKCTECDKIFRLKTELKDHLRFHDTRIQQNHRVTKRRSRQKSKPKPNYSDDSKDDILNEIDCIDTGNINKTSDADSSRISDIQEQDTKKDLNNFRFSDNQQHDTNNYRLEDSLKIESSS